MYTFEVKSLFLKGSKDKVSYCGHEGLSVGLTEDGA